MEVPATCASRRVSLSPSRLGLGTRARMEVARGLWGDRFL